MKKEFIINFINNIMDIVSINQANEISIILDHELVKYDLLSRETSLVSTNTIIEQVMLF